MAPSFLDRNAPGLTEKCSSVINSGPCILSKSRNQQGNRILPKRMMPVFFHLLSFCVKPILTRSLRDRKSTRLNSSHVSISYAVFCLKKKTYLERNHYSYLKRKTR